MFIIYLQWGILLKNSLIVAEPMPILCPQTTFHILVYTCTCMYYTVYIRIHYRVSQRRAILFRAHLGLSRSFEFFLRNLTLIKIQLAVDKIWFRWGSNFRYICFENPSLFLNIAFLGGHPLHLYNCECYEEKFRREWSVLNESLLSFIDEIKHKLYFIHFFISDLAFRATDWGASSCYGE